ncbi:MAG: MFS family permease [Kangiellaceae bacterium]|jgi:MFS family permease
MNSTTESKNRFNRKILIVSFLAWTLTNMDQAFFGYALPGILQEFDLPLEAAGLILTVSFIVAAIMSLFLGVAADRFGRGPMLSIYLAVSALLVGLQGVAGGIIMLTVFRALGFGFSTGLAPITNAYVVENVSARFRGIAMGILQCGYPLGWFLASLIAVPMLTHYGWRVMFFAAFSVIPLAGLFYWLLRDPQANTLVKPKVAKADLNASVSTTKVTVKSSVKRLMSEPYRKNSLVSMATYFTFGGAYAGSAFFFPTFFAETRGYSDAEAARLVGLSNGIGIFGYLLAAFVGEYLLTRRNTFIIWALSGTIALLGLLWLSDSRLSDTIWYGLMAALFYGALAVLPVLTAEIFPQEVRASALAICIAAPLNLGFAVFPFVVPLVVAMVGWQAGFSIIICPLLALSALIALLLPNRKSGLEVA